MKNRKQTAIPILALLFALAYIINFTGTDAFARSLPSDSKMTIRVGFFQFDGYHEINEDGSMSGYGYDFLQMIAPYAGFEYKYIGYDKSWAQMQQMLEEGEIDLVTSAHKTPERLEKFDFSDREIGFSATMLTALASNSNYSTNDYSTFNGMRVGMTANNSRNDSFIHYAKNRGFRYQPVYFENQNELAKALTDGKVDTMVTSDLRTLNNEVIIDKFDEESFYAIVKKGNSKVLQRLNYAINELNADSPNWTNTLSNTYYNHSSTSADSDISLSSSEKEYIRSLHGKKQKLKVLLLPERAPYSYFENGKPRGFFADLLENIASQYHLPYEIIETKDLKEYRDMIKKKVPDILFDSTYGYCQAEQAGYYLTGTYHTAQFCSLKRDDGPDIPQKLAILSSLADLNKEYAALCKDHEILEYPSAKDCVQAVLDKKADATYLYAYTALKYVSEDSTGFLMYAPVDGSSTSFSIGVKNGSDPVLYSVMNRIASNIGENDIQAAISNNTRFAPTSPVLSFIYHNPVTFAGIIAAVIAVALILIILKINKDKRRAVLQRTAEEKHARALEAAYDAANQANQAKSTFLSNVSHDIRTPMNVIVGMTALAEANLNDPGQVSDCLSKISVSSRHLLSLINEVLDMSKIESGTVSLSTEEFNIAELLDNLLNMIDPQAKEKHLELATHIKNLKHKHVIGDSLRLQQVFMNIANNAIKYTPDGGKIQITVSELPSQNPQYASYQFIFKDNGIGMSKEYLEKIFEPFSREEKKSAENIQGTGLGMAITKNIINMMDGTINVESEQGNGSTFTVVVRLKLQEKEAEELDETDIPKKTSDVVEDFKKSNYSGRRILVAEDYDMNRMIINEILSVTGIEVFEAANGKIAVEKFADSPLGFYDMIFMDIRMPEMNGYDATMAIRALDREDAASVPIIALSANAFAEDVEKALNAGMNEHLAKPLEIAKISNVLKKWFS